MTFAYVMNKMAQGVVGPIAWALVERVYDIGTGNGVADGKRGRS